MKLKKFRLIKIVYLAIILLLILLIVAIFIQSESINYIKRYFSKPKLIVIKDECNLLMDNILHNIRDSDDCKIRCQNECNLAKLKFQRINFVNGKGCYTCDCYCK